MSRSKEILVVEDDERFRRLLVQVAGEYDCHIIEAATAEEGMRLVQDFAADLDAASIDIRLHDGTGLGLFAELRRLAPRLPVAIFSAYITDEAVKEVESIGVAFFIRKGNGSTIDRIRSLLDYLGVPKREMAGM